MDIIKSPQNNIEAYLYNAINIEIYEEYNDNSNDSKIDVLEFFNSLYIEFSFFKENVENYLTIKNHFEDHISNSKHNLNNTYSINDYQLFDYYNALVKIIKVHFPDELRNGVIFKSCEYIESLLGRIKSSLKLDIMEDILEDIKDLDYNEKIKNLIEIKYLSLKNEKLFMDSRGETLSSQCDFEIEKLEKLSQIKTIELIPEIDLSNTSSVEKIIYLNELGIIDFLRTKTKLGISNGRVGLASVLSGITGINPGTITSSLNRLPKDPKIDNKHPYYNIKTVNKVKKQLGDLGF